MPRLRFRPVLRRPRDDFRWRARARRADVPQIVPIAIRSIYFAIQMMLRLTCDDSENLEMGTRQRSRGTAMFALGYGNDLTRHYMTGSS